jgi:hypothetical protein
MNSPDYTDTERPDCIYLKLYEDTIDLKFCEGKHIYHVRPAVPGVILPNAPELKAGGEWLYVPSVTSITRMLGGGKVDGLLWWAVAQTLEYLDEKLEGDVIVPAVEQVLDCFVSRLQSSCDLTAETVPVAVLEGVINSLDNCVGMSAPVWKATRAQAASARDRKLDEAADLGNLVHFWLESYIKHKLGLNDMPAEPTNPITARSIKRFKQWEKANDVDWVLSEQRVYSKEYHYTGTLDAVAVINRILTVVDFKTSKRVYDEHRFQTAAYAIALEEEFDDKIEQRMVIRLSKTTGAVTPTILEAEGQFTKQDDFTAFMGLRAVYARLKGA